jgi:hypothetical protein
MRTLTSWVIQGAPAPELRIEMLEMPACRNSMAVWSEAVDGFEQVWVRVWIADSKMLCCSRGWRAGFLREWDSEPLG